MINATKINFNGSTGSSAWVSFNTRIAGETVSVRVWLQDGRVETRARLTAAQEARVLRTAEALSESY